MVSEYLFAGEKTASLSVSVGIRHSRLSIQNAIRYSGCAYFLMFSGDRCCISVMIA